MRQYWLQFRKGKSRNITVAPHRTPFILCPPNPSPKFYFMRADLVEQAALIVKDHPILINMVSKRVRQIVAGHAVLVERRPGLREADLALLEIIQGKITIATPGQH